MTRADIEKRHAMRGEIGVEMRGALDYNQDITGKGTR